MLALLSLGIPAGFALLLLPLVRGTASACNVPALVERAVVVLVFVAASILLAIGRSRVGGLVALGGVLLSVVVVATWWVSAGRIVFTLELAGWVVVDACILALLAVRGGRPITRAC